MKQTITALLLALALMLGLSGCTSKKNSGNNGDTPSNSTTQNGTTNNGNTNNGTMNGGTNSGDGNTTQPGNNSRLYNGYGSYAQPGSNGSTSSDSFDDFMAGRSYDEMLRNGRVHDTDGILTDGENSVSRG